eukprot:3521806-Heterocapsa_arctica.AAC.1
MEAGRPGSTGRKSEPMEPTSSWTERKGGGSAEDANGTQPPIQDGGAWSGHRVGPEPQPVESGGISVSTEYCGPELEPGGRR